MTNIQKAIDSRIENATKKKASMFGMLGDHDDLIDAGDGLVYFTLQGTGQVMKVINKRVPNIVKYVEVGYDDLEPNILQVLKVLGVYGKEDKQPNLPNHGETHKEFGHDRIPIGAGQFMPLVTLPSSGMVVQVFGGWIKRSDGAGYTYVDSQTVDMSSYVPASGAKFALIESDSDGVLSVVEGSTVASIDIIAGTDIPAPTDILIVIITLFDGQTEIKRDSDRKDIIDPRFSGGLFPSDLTYARLDLANQPFIVPPAGDNITMLESTDASAISFGLELLGRRDASILNYTGGSGRLEFNYEGNRIFYFDGATNSLVLDADIVDELASISRPHLGQKGALHLVLASRTSSGASNKVLLVGTDSLGNAINLADFNAAGNTLYHSLMVGGTDNVVQLSVKADAAQTAALRQDQDSSDVVHNEFFVPDGASLYTTIFNKQGSPLLDFKVLSDTADAIWVDASAELVTMGTEVLFANKLILTQVDGNEYLDSLADGYIDIRATTGTRIGDGANETQILAGGDIVFVGTAGLQFAQIYEEDGTGTLALAAQDTQYQVVEFSVNGESNGATPDHTNDHITAAKDGKYKVDFSVSFSQTSAVSIEYDFHIKVNNGATDIPQTSAHRNSGGNMTVGNCGSFGILDLSANDTVELWVARLDGAAVTRTITFRALSMALIQIGGT